MKAKVGLRVLLAYSTNTLSQFLIQNLKKKPWEIQTILSKDRMKVQKTMSLYCPFKYTMRGAIQLKESEEVYLKYCSFNGKLINSEKYISKNISSEQLPGLSNTLIKKWKSIPGLRFLPNYLELREVLFLLFYLYKAEANNSFFFKSKPVAFGLLNSSFRSQITKVSAKIKTVKKIHTNNEKEIKQEVSDNTVHVQYTVIKLEAYTYV